MRALSREVTVRTSALTKIVQRVGTGRKHRRGACVAVLGLLLWVASCSDPTPVEERPIAAHPPEWTEPSKADFHGSRVAAEGAGICKSCHGADLRGTVAIPGCYDCHDGPGGHPETWVKQPEPFHGTKVQLEGPMVCTTCHGSDYFGGWSEVSCYTCHDGPGGHPQGWLDPNAHTFHGRVVTQQGNLDCRRCHGNDLLGGTSGVSCGDCHF